MTNTSARYREGDTTTTVAVVDKTDSNFASQHQVLQSLPLGVLAFDEQFRLLYANSAAIEFLKDLAVDLPNSDSATGVTLDQVLPDEIFPGWVDALNAVENLCGPGISTSLVARRGDSQRVVNVSVARADAGAGAGRALVLTLDDVTDREETDQRLFQIDKSSDRGVMAAHIAHDLNNFLGLVLGGVEIAQMAMAKGNTEKADRSLEKIKNNVGRLEEFTRGLEQLTALDASRHVVDFNQVVAGSLSYVAVQKKFLPIAIRTEFDFTIPRFEMDTAQLEQLLLNVLNNAADAIAESGRPDGQIMARTWLQDDCACLSITDNGVGIEPEIKERLFHSHLTTKPDHYGYGLVTCARIVSDHQAGFEIESEPGQGASFTFRFPLHPESATLETDS